MALVALYSIMFDDFVPNNIVFINIFANNVLDNVVENK